MVSQVRDRQIIPKGIARLIIQMLKGTGRHVEKFITGLWCVFCGTEIGGTLFFFFSGKKDLAI